MPPSGDPLGARRRARRWWRAAGVGVALAAVGCLGDSTSPRASRPVSLSVAATFGTHAATIVEFDRVRIVLYRVSGEVALDTVVLFPDTASEITLSLPVTLEDASGTETFALHLAMISGADTVFRGGPTPVTVSAGITGATATVPVRYAGTGANAAAVRIAVKDTSLFYGDSVMLTAAALDSAGDSIPNTPIEWESPDSLQVRLPSAIVGKVVALSRRGIARVIAETPTGLADTALVLVQPVATTLAVVSGSGQTADAHTQLAQPLVAKVGAADGLGVRDVAVRFAVSAGNGTVADTLVRSDTAGLVTTRWTAGTVARTDSVLATVVGRTIAAVTFTSAVTAGPAKRLDILADPSAVTAGARIAPAILVAARDAYDNVATSFTGYVILVIGANPAGATLGGADSTAAVAGVATFPNVTLNRTGTGYTLVAIASGLASDTTAAFGVAPAGAAALAFTAGPAARVAGDTQTVVVTVQDALGNTASGFTDTIRLALGTNPSGATIEGTTAVAAVAGVANFPALVIKKAGTGYTLAASATGVPGVTSSAFNVAPAAAVSLTMVAGNNQIGVVSTALALPLQVSATDQFGNGVPGTTVTWAVTAGGGSLSAASLPTGGDGMASVTWTMGATAVADTARATASGLTGSPAVFAAVATPIPVTRLWKGGDAAGATAWANANNWSPATLPGPTDTAYVPVHASSQPVLTADQSIGTLILDPGAQLDVGTYSLTVNGSLDAGNTIVGAGTVLMNGTGTLRGTLPGLSVTGSVTLSGRTTASRAAVTGTLKMGGNTLATDSLALPGSGRVLMQQANDSLLVAGGSYWNGDATADTALTAGVLLLRGNVHIASGAGFNASGTHLTVLDGPVLQSLVMQAPGPGPSQAHFRDVRFANAEGVAVDVTGVHATGAGTLASGQLNSVGPVTVLGNFATAPSTSVQAPELALGGAVTVQGTYQVPATIYVGTGQLVDSALPYQHVEIRGTAALAGPTTVPGRLLVSTGVLRVNGEALTVGDGVGSDSLLLAPSGHLLMQHAADSVTVNGVFFEDAVPPGDTLLTAGVLRVRGNVAFASAAGFTASGPHRTVLDGVAPQTVTMKNPGLGATQGHFMQLEMRDTAGVMFLSDGAIAGTVVVPPRLGLQGLVQTDLPTRAITVGGDIIDSSGGRWQVGRTVLAGNRLRTLPFNLSTRLTVTGNDTLAGTIDVRRALEITGSLALNGHVVYVADSLLTTGAGRLVMQGPAESILVMGSAFFGGGPSQLTDGVIRLNGNFTQTGTTSFAPSGSHRVVMFNTGAVADTVSFADATNSAFRYLDIDEGLGNDVVLSTRTRVHYLRLVSGSIAGDTIRLTADTAEFLTTQSSTSLKELEVTGDLRVAPGSEGFLGVRTVIFSNPSTTSDEMIRNDVPFGNLWVTGRARVDTTSYPPITIGGNLYVDGPGALLDLAGTPLAVRESLFVQNSGRVVMTDPSASLVVSGPALFAGGANDLSAGRISVGGDFAQGGPAGAFAPTGTEVWLDGAGDQAVSFGNTTSSFFRRLQINKSGGGVILASNVRASFFRIQSGTAVTGPSARLLSDSIDGWRGSSLTPLAVEVTAVLGDTGTFSPDTTVFTGADQVIPYGTYSGPYAYKSIRVAQSSGTATFAPRFSSTVTNLLVSSGTLSLNGNKITVAGLFATENSGVLQMTSATDSLIVGGNVWFAGASTAGTLTDGVMIVAGNVVQLNGTSPSSFAPSGSHKVLLSGINSQMVSFQSPASYFNRLDVRKPNDVTGGRVLRLVTDVAVNDSLIVGKYSEIVSDTTALNDQRLKVAGYLWIRSDTSSTPNVHPRVVELQHAPTFYALSTTAFAPDTTVYLGSGGYALPLDPAIQYKSVRIATSSAITCDTCTASLSNDLVIGGLPSEAGKFAVNDYANLTVSGKLKTEGAGVLAMGGVLSGGMLTVGDSTIFAGGNTTGLLQLGTLKLLGDFEQRNNSCAEFAPSGDHQTYFYSSAPRTISFKNPGIAGCTSAFNTFGYRTTTPGGLKFLSSAFVKRYADIGNESSYTYNVSGHSGDSLVFLYSVSTGMQVRFDSLRLVARIPAGGSVNISGATFGDYDPNVTQLYIEGPMVVDQYFYLYDPVFLTTPNSGSYHLDVFDTDGPSPAPLTVNVLNPTPPSAETGAKYRASNGAVIYWNPVM